LDNLNVNCYSGYTYAERPESFLWGGMECQVAEIEKSWQEPGERHFIVRTKDHKLFKLSYNESNQQWMIIEQVKG